MHADKEIVLYFLDNWYFVTLTLSKQFVHWMAKSLILRKIKNIIIFLFIRNNSKNPILRHVFHNDSFITTYSSIFVLDQCICQYVIELSKYLLLYFTTCSLSTFQVSLGISEAIRGYWTCQGHTPKFRNKNYIFKFFLQK